METTVRLLGIRLKCTGVEDLGLILGLSLSLTNTNSVIDIKSILTPPPSTKGIAWFNSFGFSPDLAQTPKRKRA